MNSNSRKIDFLSPAVDSITKNKTVRVIVFLKQFRAVKRRNIEILKYFVS